VPSILIVDDFAEWRARVREILKNQPQWQIVGEACDGFQAIQRAAELHPDLVLLDVGMPALSGIEAAAHIQQISPQSKIVFLTQDGDADIRHAALAAGAHGYVAKIDVDSTLLTTIAAVLV
jgi:DNA-binding NarL/FixJ family response regulator